MIENQSSFNGWARVEVMGHQTHIGHVTTEVFGQAVLFRIDQPRVPETEETLTRAEWIGEIYAQPGSVVKRPAIEAVTVLVGSSSIYRIIPCDEGVALRAIRESQRRPLIPVKLIDRPQIQSDQYDGSDEQDSDVLFGGHGASR